MTKTETIPDEHFPDKYHDVYSKTVFGFWIYLLTDFILFGALFATYIVLHNNMYGIPSTRDLFDLPFTFVQTLILLTSAFTIGMGGALAHQNKKNSTLILYGITFVLGIAFMWMELTDFSRIMSLGYTWKTSGFLSAFYTLIGTHGIHMVFGLLWILVLMIPIFFHGLTEESIKRLTCLRMFWQFLNVIWVFIFTLVYLIGGI